MEGDVFQRLVDDGDDIVLGEHARDLQHLKAFGPDQGGVENVQAVGGQDGEDLVEGNLAVDEV